MSNIFSSRDPASTASMQLGLGVAAAAFALHDIHSSAVERANQRRAEREAYQYACDLDAAKGRAADLGRIAIRAVRHVAQLEAECRRLRIALEQRQGIIDRAKQGK